MQGYSRCAFWTVPMVLALALGFDPNCTLAAGRVDFQLATLDGDAFVKISDFPDRVVLINVWGTDCPPCAKETPLLNAQSQIYTNVQFLGIGTDDRISSLRFVSRFHVGYPQLRSPKDPDGLLRQLGDLRGALPFTVVLDSKHRICASRLGAVDADWIADAVKQCSSNRPPG